MKITKQSFGYVLETGIAVIEFRFALIEKNSIPDVSLFDETYIATIPNQHIKEFKQKFIEAGGVIE